MKTQLTKRILALLLTLVMVLSLAPMTFAEEAGDLTGKTVILHTNDTHGALMGFAQVAKVKADFEARGAQVVLVDAGDFSQGTTYVSVHKGADAVAVMNAAGYDFVTLGNHEFDFGYAQLMENLEAAKFTAICADVYKKDGGETILPATAVKELDGLKIGFFGMETPETQTKVNPGLISELEFGTIENGKYLSSAQNAIAALKEQNADLIIGLVHLGVDAESEPYRSTDLYPLIQDDVDFLIDGHSHTVMTEGPNGEPIQSTGTKVSKTALANVGCIVIDNETKTIEDNYLIPLGEGAPVDPAVAAVAQEIMDAVDAEYGAKFAESAVDLNGDKAPGNRTMETNLGDLITDAMYWSVMNAMDAETLGVPEENVVAITNGGGIRAPIKKGDITMNDVFTVLPFGNTVAVVYVTGAELLEALEASTYAAPEGLGGFPQVAGLTMTVNTAKAFDEGELYPGSTYHRPNSIQRVTIKNINGKDFDPEATYAVITNNFCAAGGDTYYVFKNASEQFDTSIPMDQAVMEYITEELGGVIGSEYAGPQGRLTILDQDLTGKTVILHTNDTHGALMGFAQVAKVKTDYEDMGATVILVDAGDFSQGTTYVSIHKGEDAITVMNAAGYDYVTLGNHEFDFGYHQLMSNLDAAQFTAICSDVFDKWTEGSILPYAAMDERDGLKIGFFGMETPETQTKVNPGLITALEFGTNENGKFLSSAQEAIATLKEQGADLIIGLVHLGVDPESEPYRSVDLYNEIKDDVAFLIDGHSHTVMTAGPNGEPIQSTGTKVSKTALDNVGCIVIDNATKTIESHKLIPLGEGAPVDPAVAAVAQGIMDAVDAEYGAKFAESKVELNGDKAPGNRNMETNLGDLIANALHWSVLEKVDAATLGVSEDNLVAITNGGGIRAWIHKGDVTMNDVHEVLPFGNTVAVVYVTGAELLEALEASTYCTPTAVGGFPQIAGMHITIDTKKSYDAGDLYPGSTYYKPNSIRRVTINDVHGNPFDPEATYAVVTNNFCAAGGDTYYVFKNASKQFDTGIPMDEALIDYIQENENGVIGEVFAEPMGRITIRDLFTDVSNPSKYYYEPVYWAYNYDPQITAGKTATTFGVKKDCTRAEIVTFLWKAFGAEEPTTTECKFTDVQPNKYYYKAVLWAVENGITGGLTATTFGVKKTCTRAQAVTFLYAAADKPEPTKTEHPFTDVKAGAYYEKALLWAVEHGITGGTSATTFSPKKNCTREQIVTFLYAFLRDKEYEFEFLVTSDLHGQIYATDYTQPYEKSGTYSRGLTRVASYIKEQKAIYGKNVYTVDMGDTFQGAPLTYYYAFNKPEEKDPAILAFRTIGYDMWVVGNHEFNYGLPILTRQMDYAVSEATETESQLTISMANYLKAETNDDETKDWATWRDVKPYVIKNFGGCKVAVIGFGNPNIPKWDVPANWEGIYFAPIVETYKHYEAEMLEQADMIVVVAHSGTDSDPGSDFMKELVESTNTIAFAFSGHEHKNTITTVQNTDGKDVPILSPYTKARRIAQVKVNAERKGVTFDFSYEINAELKNMEGYPIDEDLAELLKPYETDVWENYMLQPIGQALGDYPAADLGTKPSAFMDLINTVQTWGAYDRTGENTPDKTEDDTPAMLSISAPLTVGDNANLISEGPIVLGDMFGLYRFENWFYQITMSGEEVHQWLEFAATKIRVDGEGNPYVTSSDLTYYDVIMGDGFHYDIDVSKPEGQRVVNMTYNGETVAADQEFTVVVNNYRYNGGGNYVKWLNDHGCEFTANDPDRIIYSTQFDMIQGEDEGQARALLVSYIKEQTEKNGGITPFITSTWTVSNGAAEPAGVCFPSTDNADIEKYGNIFTNLDAADFFADGTTWGDIVTVKFLDKELDLAVVPTYSYVDQGTAAVIVGKNGETGEPEGRVKMAINMGNFAASYGLATKTTNPDNSYYWTACEGVEFPVPVTIEMKEAGGYLSELLMHDINRTNDREDYPELSDEEFANFRQITTTGMGDHLYRGSSPINPEIGRNTYADAALENAKVTVIMNLANDQAEAEAYEGFADTYYAGQNVIYLNLGVDFQAADFQSGLANGLRHFAENKGVYYVHCTEGKDRAGFVSALLECLMGASYDEVVADYLKTYTNYYTVVDGQQQALSEETLDAIANSNIIKTLQTAFDVTDLKTADLAAEAEAYITEIGLSADELSALKDNLAGEYGGEEPGGPAIVKVTEAPADWTVGTYYLVCELEDSEGNVTAGKLFNGNDASNGDGYVNVTIDDGTIAFDAHLFCVSFETMEGGYAIKTGNGYMGNVTTGNSVTTSSTTPVLNTVSFSEDGILLVSNGRYFRFNTTSGQDRFRYFNQNTSNDKYPLPALYVLVNAD